MQATDARHVMLARSDLMPGGTSTVTDSARLVDGTAPMPAAADEFGHHLSIAPGPAAPRRKRKLSTIILVPLLMLAAGLAVWAVRSVFRTAATEVSTQPAAQEPRAGTQPGALAPLFEVPGYDGRGPVRLAAYRGHPVILNFWTSWCPPCKAEAGILESAYLTYQGRGVVFIGIDLQNDTWEESKKFLRQHGITYPAGRDVAGAVGRAYRVTAIPTTYFIGPDGRIRAPAFTGGFLGARGARDLAMEIESLLLQ